MEPSNKKTVWAQVGAYTSLGVLLPASTVAGYLLGLLFDRLLGTHFLYLVFLLLGIAAGFVQLVRVVSRNSG